MLHTCMHLFFTLPQILNICNAVGIYEQSDEKSDSAFVQRQSDSTRNLV